MREHAGEPYEFRFEIQRELVETVVAQRAVDWSNSLFLSCRFRAWRAGPYNEYVYNFFKSLSVERMRRTEAEALRKLDPERGGIADEEIRIGDYICERTCPHRQRRPRPCSARSTTDSSCAPSTGGASISTPASA